MKKIKINWNMTGLGLRLSHTNGFSSYIYDFLKENYDVEFSKDPDYLICDVASHEDLSKECIKICHSIENKVPDFGRYDYVIGFDSIAFGDRYLRIPLWACYKKAYMLMKDRDQRIPRDEELLARKFCSFVVSNGAGADPLREMFFRELSKYKKVDSGGRYLNNVGGPVADKLDFCKGYKFNIAFENSVVPGYTTEKIMEPLAVHSVPIYYGDPLITEDFNEACMVRVKSKEDVGRAIEEIIALDTDDEAYLKKCKAHAFVRDWDYYKKAREDFLRHIFDQPLQDARRLVDCGWQAGWRNKMRKLYMLHDMIVRVLRILRKINPL